MSITYSDASTIAKQIEASTGFNSSQILKHLKEICSNKYINLKASPPDFHGYEVGDFVLIMINEFNMTASSIIARLPEPPKFYEATIRLVVNGSDNREIVRSAAAALNDMADDMEDNDTYDFPRQFLGLIETTPPVIEIEPEIDEVQPIVKPSVTIIEPPRNEPLTTMEIDNLS